MLRRYNYTGRLTIDKQHAVVEVRSTASGAAPIFDINLRLDSYDFEPEASVRVEANRGNIGQRWSFGTVGSLTPPSDAERRLTEVPDGSQFRVVVVASDGSGRLLGACEKISPQLPERSLIALKATDLGGEVWRLDFGEGDLPVLLVNSQLEMMSEAARSDHQFRSLVMPQVFRSVLNQIMFVERADFDDGDEERWYHGWLRLSKTLIDDHPPNITQADSEAERAVGQDWIDRVVDAFSAQRLNAVELYRSGQGNS